MRIEYDEAKSRRNAERRGISFADALELLSGPHVELLDARRDYGEMRGDAYRIISLRKANRREVDASGPYVRG